LGEVGWSISLFPIFPFASGQLAGFYFLPTKALCSGEALAMPFGGPVALQA